MAIPGTNSTAIQNPDGTWDILDVPIVHVGSIPRFNAAGERVDEFSTDEAWFQNVLAAHQQGESDAYMGRVFLDHHDHQAGSQPDSGFLRPRRIGPITVKGARVQALFADIVAVPDEVYQTWIKAGRVPYRSIESREAESGWIDGLALMATRSPHYQLPMLTIGREIQRVPGGTREPMAARAMAVACSTSERAVAILRAEESTMPEEPKDEGKAKDEPKDEPKGDKKDEKKSKPASGWKSAFETFKATEIALDEIPDAVAAIREFADSLETSAGGGMIEEPPFEETPATETPVAEQEPTMAKAGTPNDRLIRAEALAAAASSRAAAIEAEMARRDAVDKAVLELQEYSLGSDPRAVLMAKAKEHGLQGLALYVSTIKAHGRKSPGPGGAVGIPDQQVTDLPKEVMAYTQPAEREVALKAFARFRQMEQAGYPTGDLSLAGMIRRDIQKMGLNS